MPGLKIAVYDHRFTQTGNSLLLSLPHFGSQTFSLFSCLSLSQAFKGVSCGNKAWSGGDSSWAGGRGRKKSNQCWGEDSDSQLTWSLTLNQGFMKVRVQISMRGVQRSAVVKVICVTQMTLNANLVFIWVVTEKTNGRIIDVLSANLQKMAHFG